MFVNLKQLEKLYPRVSVKVSLDGSTITLRELPHINNGKSGIKVPKGWVLSEFGNRTAMFNGPTSYDTQMDVVSKSTIQFDVQEPYSFSNTTTGLTSAPTCTAVPAPVLENGFLTATVCVASSNASNLPQGATNIINMGGATSAQVSIKPNDVTYKGNKCYSMNLPDGRVLYFTFHCAIAEEASALLKQAQDEADLALGRQNIQTLLDICTTAANIDAQRCRDASAANIDAKRCRDASAAKLSSMPSLSCILQQPMFDDGTGSTGNWAVDAAVASTHAVPFPREKEANALTGAFDNVLFRKEAKAQKEKEAQRQAELAKCAEEEEAQRLEQETQRQSELAEQQHTTNIHDAPYIMVPPVCVKTYHSLVIRTLLSIANQYGFELQGNEQQYTQGTAYFIDVSPLLVAGFLTMRVSARGNEIIVGELTDDGTLRWGTCVNVDHKSYGALMALFPEMSAIVQQVIATRVALKVQKPHQNLQQGLLPFPEPMRVLPVFDTRGNVVAYHQAPQFTYQQMPPLVMFNQPSAYPPRA
jgi:hypothetical protein